MKCLAYLFALSLMTGCSTAPKLHECKGEFRPVNKSEQKGAAVDAASTLSLCAARGTHEQG